MQNEESPSRYTVRDLLSRDFILGFLALFAFLAASYALVPTLPIYLAGLGSNEREIGVLIGIYGASSLVSRLFVGGVLVKNSEKRVMMVGGALFAGTFLACIAAHPFWPFFVVRFFQGIAFACLDTAALAFIVDIIPPAYRGRAIGYFLLAPNLALALAPSLGMLIINHYSFTFLFLTCTVLSLCAFIFSYKIRGAETVKPEMCASPHNTLFLERRIIVPAVCTFLQNFVWGALIAFLPLYAIRCGITNPGYFFSAIAIMLIAGRALGGRILDTQNKEKIILTFVFTSTIAMVILSFSTTLSLIILVGLLWGTGSAFFYPASMAYSLDYADSSGGAAIGTLRALADLGLALGPVIMGLIIPLAGYRAMFLCLALVCVINLVYFQFYVRKRRRCNAHGS
jgi:predicted MFS family arabinose efflux permease